MKKEENKKAGRKTLLCGLHWARTSDPYSVKVVL